MKRAALTTFLFVGRQVRVIHVGDCRVYRRRASQLVPLTTEQVTPLPDGSTVLTSAVGSDPDVQTECIDDIPEFADRYIILSKGGYAALPYVQLSELLGADLDGDALAHKVVNAVRADPASRVDATAVVIDVRKCRTRASTT